MSHLLNFETCVTDQEALVRALVRMDVPRNQIEVHAQSVVLRSYHSNERANANVIIRRNVFNGSHSDIGWERKADGSYVGHLDEYDYGHSIHCDKTWQDKLYTFYNVEKSKMELEARKIPYTEAIDEKGRIQLRAKFVIQETGPQVKVRL